jgi:hypothetical protein
MFYLNIKSSSAKDFECTWLKACRASIAGQKSQFFQRLENGVKQMFHYQNQYLCSNYNYLNNETLGKRHFGE